MCRYDGYKFSAIGLNLINERAEFLSYDGIIKQQFDPYIFVCTTYLQRRQSLVYDGNRPRKPMPTFDDPAPMEEPKRK